MPAGSSRNGSALAAGLSAGATVSAAFTCHGGIQAASRKAHAECAVGKGLYLDTAVFRKVFNHIEADLTGKHGTGNACSFTVLESAEIMDAHLSAGMERKLRKVFSQERSKPEILNEHGIGADAVQLGGEIEGGRNFTLE